MDHEVAANSRPNDDVAGTLSLSVVIPAYNSEETVGRAVDSAWKAGAFEVIVVDDGSIDSTAAQATAGRCTVIRQVNSGASAARRTGLMRSTGDLIVLLDADDTLVLEGVAASTKIMERTPSYCAVVGATRAIARNHASRMITPGRNDLTTERLLVKGTSVGPPGAIIWRRTALIEVANGSIPGLWPRYAEDYELIIRGTIFGAVGCHDGISCEYQMFGGKSSNHPFEDNQCAELIRRHYAHVARIDIKFRGNMELRALAQFRRAHDRPGKFSFGTRIYHYAMAEIEYPPMALKGLRAKMRRRRMTRP